MGLYRTLRFKLFALISGLLGVVVAVLTWYFPATQAGELERRLVAEAQTLSHMLMEPARSSIAFADVETAREAFDSAAAQPDLAFVALYRADGTLLYSQGQGGADRVRVSAPVESAEGPRGTLVVEMSSERIRDQARRARMNGLWVGLCALVAGMLAAWWLGTSFGRRIGAVTAHARRVAAGQLDVPPLADAGRDEIGRLSKAFNVMVAGLGELSREMGSAADLIDASTEMFLEMARDAEAKTSDAQAAEFAASMVAGLSELGLYSQKLRQVLGRLKGGETA